MYELAVFSELGKGLTELAKLAEKFKMLPEEQLNKPLTPENCRMESISLRENKDRDNLNQVVQNKIGDVDEKDSSITNSEIIDEACETKKEGVSEEKRQELKELGWSDEVIGYIASDAEAEIYQKAGLVEVEINGKKALVRNDMDFEQKDEFGLSNKERMESGHSPINKNGEVIVLHHIGQKPDSPLAELTKSEHMGNGNDTILHDKSKSSEVHNSENEGTWRKERNEHWKSRANNNI